MTVPAKSQMQTQPQGSGNVIESVIAKGDLSKLSPEERTRYYIEVCRSLGLNPLTQPFQYIVLNGRLTLYATRTCTDQLRKINGVSLEIVSRDVADGILTIHVRARMPDGRTDEDLGAVAYPETLKGEARANAELKCITKAKRRATLSICGLGWLDETEVEDIPAGSKRPAPPAANVMPPLPTLQSLPPHDPQTGEILEEQAPAPETAASVTTLDVPQEELPDLLAKIERHMMGEALKGTAALRVAWENLFPPDQAHFEVTKERVWKPAAMLADKQIAAGLSQGGAVR